MMRYHGEILVENEGPIDLSVKRSSPDTSASQKRSSPDTSVPLNLTNHNAVKSKLIYQSMINNGSVQLTSPLANGHYHPHLHPHLLAPHPSYLFEHYGPSHSPHRMLTSPRIHHHESMAARLHRDGIRSSPSRGHREGSNEDEDENDEEDEVDGIISLSPPRTPSQSHHRHLIPSSTHRSLHNHHNHHNSNHHHHPSPHHPLINGCSFNLLNNLMNLPVCLEISSSSSDHPDGRHLNGHSHHLSNYSTSNGIGGHQSNGHPRNSSHSIGSLAAAAAMAAAMVDVQGDENHNHHHMSRISDHRHNSISSNREQAVVSEATPTSSPNTSPTSSSTGLTFPASSTDKKRLNRPLTGRHVRHGTGASAQTLVKLKIMLQKRRRDVPTRGTHATSYRRKPK